MSSVLNDTRLLNCDRIRGPEDAFLEAKNEYNGYEHSNVLSALFNWRSRDYTSNEVEKRAMIPDTKEYGSHVSSADPFRQRIAGLGRTTSLLAESNDWNNSRTNRYTSRNDSVSTGPAIRGIAELSITRSQSSPPSPPIVSAPTASPAPSAQHFFSPNSTTGYHNCQQYSTAEMEKEKLHHFIFSTSISFLNPPRPGKKLLVLDLDHTLLDFTRKEALDLPRMKRPFMDEFLTAVYPYYDLVVWSQTHWKYIDIKVTQLGMMSNPNFKLCFILDKTYMFNVSNDKAVSNKVKPLQLIWAKYPNLWGSSNTVHVDDIEKNFCLNPAAGILISPFHRAPLPPALQAASTLAALQQSQLYDSHIYNSHRPVYNTCAALASAPAFQSGGSPSPPPGGGGGQCGIGCGSLWSHSHSHSSSGPGAADSLEESTPASSGPPASSTAPDVELVSLAKYLVKLAQQQDVSSFDHSAWSASQTLVRAQPPTLN